MKHGTLLLLVVATLGACAQRTTEQQIVDDAAAALGGRDRILAVKTLVIEGEGSYGNLGQDMTPEATGQTFVVSGYKRSIDVTAGRARVEQTRAPNFAYFQGQAPQKQVLGVDGGVGYNIPATGNPTRVSNAIAKDRRAEIYHHPLTIVRAALDPSARLTNPRTAGTERVVDVTTRDGLTFTLAIDSTTRFPTRVVSMTDNTNLGDVAIETGFADYQDVSGLKLPGHFMTKVDKYTTADIRATKQTIDGDVSDLTAPPAASSAASILAPPPATVTAEEVAKGIWFLAGQSHHSVLVEFSDHLLLIEAPSERYACARRHRQGTRAPARQAADCRCQHASSLRPFRRYPRRRFGRLDGLHRQGEWIVLRTSRRPIAFNRAGCAGEESETAQSANSRQPDGAQGQGDDRGALSHRW